MNALIRAELLKLGSTRTTRLLVVGGLAIAALVGTATATTAGEQTSAALGNAENIANIVGVSAMPGLFMLILGVLAMAGEYQHRTITQTFLSVPVRGRVVAAKLAAIAAAGVATATAMMTTALLAALPHLWADGGSIHLVNAQVGRTALGTLLAGALFGIAGTSLGALLRSQIAAVVAIAAWVAIGEAVLALILGPDVAHWLPGGAASALAASGTHALPLWAAASVLTGYCAAGVAATTRLTLRRDVA
jgi:ABC-2 type transport system permease protein